VPSTKGSRSTHDLMRARGRAERISNDERADLQSMEVADDELTKVEGIIISLVNVMKINH